MTIEREKENGTLTGAAGEEIIECLDITCSYLLRREPELKKEVHGIMRPIAMLQRERAENEIKRISERNENAIKRLVEKNYRAKLSRQEAKEDVQDIFSLSEEEAEEKMERYWGQFKEFDI